MSTVNEFLHMGGYAFYVWTAYAVWAVVMVANVVAPWMRERATRRRLARRPSLEAGRS